jgi:mono/diheme cytochrome c family protein
MGRLLSWRPSRRFALRSAIGLVVLFVLIQLVPYGRAHSNPPVVAEPEWATPRTRELMVQACFDCHSNEVTWPWYSNVAPMSWVVTRHVEEGRSEVNYSEFTAGSEADDTIESILDGEMPPGYYTMFGLHEGLSDDEIDELVAGLRATPGLSEGEGEDEEDEHEEEDEEDDD